MVDATLQLLFPSLKGFDFGLDSHLPHCVFRSKSRQIACFRLLLSHSRGSLERFAFFDILSHNWIIGTHSREAKVRQIAQNRFKSPFPALGQISMPFSTKELLTQSQYTLGFGLCQMRR